jgi:glycerophosphoryl diester phosphodiesterase
MVMVVGHRGARELWPENSLTGFRHALTLGVDAVEFDVHATRDGGMAVIHDPTLERTAEGSGPVVSRSVDELGRTILRGTDGEGIPSLEAVLDVFQGSAVELQVEIKTDVGGTPYEGLERRIVALVRQRCMERQVVATSFVPGILETVRREWPHARLLASLDRRSAEMLGGVRSAFDRFASLGAMVAVERTLLSEQLDFCLDRLGSERLAVWTPNAGDEIAYWMAQPIRHICTDRPDLAIGARMRARTTG